MSEVINIKELNERIERESVFVDTLRNEMGKVIVGQSHLVDTLLIGLLSNGHILLEGVPGLAKTLAITTLAKAVDACFSRIQFTPDLLPADLIGTLIYSQKNEDFVVRKGPIFANFVLADEINRSPAKVQSALLEAMEEGQVTVDGVAHPVPQPFLVIATQNPAGASGTQLLPDSQLDRFMIRLSIGYPKPADELELLRRKQKCNPLDEVRQVVDLSGLSALRNAVDAVHTSDDVLDYIIRLVAATRGHPLIIQGASPRATLAVTAMAKSAAFICGRDYVIPEDVSLVFRDVVTHRLLLSPRAEATAGADPAKEILRSVAPPRIG